jgi:hypothetical protein
MNKLFKNERQFQDANARLTEMTGRLAPSEFPPDFSLDLYCECANKACLERFGIPYFAYKSVASDPLKFAVKPEHYLPEFETVHHKEATYWIIEKRAEKLTKAFEV